MRRLMSYFIIAVFIGIHLFRGISFSQTLVFDSQGKKQKVWGSYSVSGIFGANFLLDDVQGDKNLFLSQFNLKRGYNFSQISFQAHRIPEKKGFLDVITLEVRGFGAEPYGRAVFRLEKRNLFFLSGGYTERRYFADVASFVNPLFDPSLEGVSFTSFHTWNTKEKTLDLSGRLKATSWLSFDISWQRTKLEGDSILTLRLLNNEFPLSEPIDQTSNVFQLGSELNIKGRIFYKISGIYHTFKLDQTTSSQGTTNVGIRGLPFEESSNYLTLQSRQSTVDIKTWAINQSFHIIPFKNISIRGSYNKSWTEGETSGEEDLEGRFVWPLYDLVNSAAYANSGELKKDFNKGDVTLHFDILPKLRVRAGYNFYKYTIENSDALDYSFTRIYYNKTVSKSENFNPLIDMKYDKFFADAVLTIGQHLTASGGYVHSANKLDLRLNESEESHTYKLDSFYGSLGLRFSKALSLKATYEKGDYNKVFARLIPLKSTSAGIQGKFTLGKCLTGSLHFKYQKLENSRFSYASTVNGYGAHIRFNPKNGIFGAFASISKNDFSSVLDIIRYVSLFVEREDISEYTSDTLHYSGGFWFRKGIVNLDGGYSYTKTEGTFPIKMEFPYFTIAIRMISNLAITLNYRFYNHKQMNFISQNYKAHLFSIGFLSRF